MKTPEEWADELVRTWYGRRVSLNQHRADIAAALRRAAADSSDESQRLRADLAAVAAELDRLQCSADHWYMEAARVYDENERLRAGLAELVALARQEPPSYTPEVVEGARRQLRDRLAALLAPPEDAT